MQENNSFLLRSNRFKNPELSEKSFSCIQLKKNLKSIHLSEEMFTNYIKNMGTEKYRKIKNIWEKHKLNSNIINLYMNADELINDGNKIIRLKKIIEKNINKTLTKNEMINNIYKFKHIDDNEIQFYFYYDGKILNLVLIDLFHLGIKALKNGRDIFKIRYDQNKNNKLCLSHVINY